jgi:F-type H+-transporting ATPase subunit epsilon
MADRLRLEVATPTRLVVSGEADEVVVPGTEGAFGVLPGHAPLLSLVGIGEVMYRTGREEHHLAVSGGFAEVGPDHVTILAETAERPEEVDLARARAAWERPDMRHRPHGGRDAGACGTRAGAGAPADRRPAARRRVSASRGRRRSKPALHRAPRCLDTPRGGG